MISFELWLAYVATVSIIVITPGPSVLLAASHGMSHGLNKTFGTITGDLSANIIQMILAALGLGAILLASESLFYGMKWVGVGYLVYMGIKQWRSSSQNLFKTENGKNVSVKKLFLTGFSVSASNPKAILFFAALFPMFIDPSLAKLPQIIILGMTFIILDGSSLIVYAKFAEKIKTWLESRGKENMQNKIIGSLLLLAAGALSLVKRS